MGLSFLPNSFKARDVILVTALALGACQSNEDLAETEEVLIVDDTMEEDVISNNRILMYEELENLYRDGAGTVDFLLARFRSESLGKIISLEEDYVVGEEIELDVEEYGTQNLIYRGHGVWTSGLPGDRANGSSSLQSSNGSDLGLEEANQALSEMQNNLGIQAVFSVRNRFRGAYERPSFNNVQEATVNLGMNYGLGLVSRTSDRELTNQRLDEDLEVLLGLIKTGNTLVHCREGLHRSVYMTAIAMYILDRPVITKQDYELAEVFGMSPEMYRALIHIGEEVDADTARDIGLGLMSNAYILLRDIDRLNRLSASIELMDPNKTSFVEVCCLR